MKISRSIGVALILLVLLIFIAPNVTSAPLDTLKNSFQSATSGDIFKDITNLTFLGALVGIFAGLGLTIWIFKGQWFEGSKKVPTLILLGMTSFFAADSVASTLSRGLLKIGFKEGLGWAWDIIMFFAFVGTVLLEKEKDFLERGVQFAVVWLIVSSFIGPFKSTIVTGADFKSSVITNAFYGILWVIGIWGLGAWNASRVDARKRSEEKKQKLEDEKKQANSIESVRESLRTELKADEVKLGEANAKANQAQPVMQTGNPQMMYPMFVGMGQALPSAYLPQFVPVVPTISAPQIYDDGQRELAEYQNLRQKLVANYGETDPGKEIIYLNKVIKDLQTDLQIGEPKNWQEYLKGGRSAFADEIERFDNPGAKESAAALRKLAGAKGISIKTAIRSSITLLQNRLQGLLKMKKDFIRSIDKALAFKQKEIPKVVESYRNKDDAVKRLNDDIARFNNDMQRYNDDLYQAHKIPADAQQVPDVDKLKELFEEERNRILELIKQMGTLKEEEKRLQSVIEAAKKGYKEINNRELIMSRVRSAKEISQRFFGRTKAMLTAPISFTREAKAPEAAGATMEVER